MVVFQIWAVLYLLLDFMSEINEMTKMVQISFDFFSEKFFRPIFQVENKL